jgi:hypothetical protein
MERLLWSAVTTPFTTRCCGVSDMDGFMESLH